MNQPEVRTLLPERPDPPLAWLSSCDLVVLDSLAGVQDMVQELLLGQFDVFDVETTGLRVVDDRVVALQFCADGQRAFFIAIDMLDPKFTNLPIADVVRICAPLWETGVVGHNLGYDWKMMRPFVDFNIVADTMLEAKLIDATVLVGLKHLAKRVLKLDEVITFKSLFPPKVKKIDRRFDTVPYNWAVPYALQDVVVSWRLHERFLTLLDVTHFIYQLEHQVIKPLAEMELLGVRLDVSKIAAGQVEAERIMAEAMAEIEMHAGRTVELSKTNDVRKLLFDELKLPIVKETPGSTPTDVVASTDATTLKMLSGKHPIIAAIQRYREVDKLRAGFLEPLPTFVQGDGCVHTSFHQYGAVTGRMSASEPNLQQIPTEKGKGNDELRKAIRGAFLPPEGFIGFLDIDYSQVEYRLFASLSGDRGLMEAYENDWDVHRQTASIMFKVPIDQVDDIMRGRGKTLNFASIYGASKYKLSEMMGCTLEEAETLLANYWAALKQAGVYCEHVRNQARRREYVETYFGRKRRLPDINASDWKKKGKAERDAVNTVVQGTAADLIKIALVRAAEAIKQQGFKSRLCLIVHDELVLAHHPVDDLDALSEAMRDALEITQPGWCAIKSEPGYGPNWQDIGEFSYPSRRPNGVAAPSQLLSPIVLEPASMRDEVLTVTFGATTTSEVASNLQLEVAARPGGSRLILVMPDGSEHRYPTGVRVDRKFLMQMRAENLEYTFSPLLHERLLKESSGR